MQAVDIDLRNMEKENKQASLNHSLYVCEVYFYALPLLVIIPSIHFLAPIQLRVVGVVAAVTG